MSKTRKPAALYAQAAMVGLLGRSTFHLSPEYSGIPPRVSGGSLMTREQLSGSCTSSMILETILGFLSSLMSMIRPKPYGGSPRAQDAATPPASDPPSSFTIR